MKKTDYSKTADKKEDLQKAPNLRIVSEDALLSCVARKIE
jgi:hypothetical protein